MSYERIKRDGTPYAEVIWAGTTVEKTRFFSDAGSSLQFGLLTHEARFVEPAPPPPSDASAGFAICSRCSVDFSAASSRCQLLQLNRSKFHEIV